jgi:hypothetical protein
LSDSYDEGSDESFGLSLAEIKAAQAWAQRQYSKRNEQINDNRKHRLRLVEPYVPEKAKKLTNIVTPKIPLVWDMARRSQGLWAADLPIPHRAAIDPSDDEELKANSRIEQGLMGLYQGLLGPIYGQITDAFPNDGQGVWKVMLKRDRWLVEPQEGESGEDYDKRKKRHRYNHKSLPFWAEHVDTTSYFPRSWDEEGLCEVLEITYRDRLSVYNKYGLDPSHKASPYSKGKAFAGITGRSADTCEFLEYWTRDYFVYVVDGQEVRRERHNYGRVPYYDPEFASTSMHELEYQTESVTNTLCNLEDQLNSLVAMQTHGAFWNYFPQFQLSARDPEAVPLSGEEKMDAEPLGTLGITPGYEWKALSWPLGREATELREFILRMAQDITLAPILQGNMERQMSSPAITSMIATAKSIFGIAAINFRLQWNSMAAWILEMVETELKEPVPVQWHGELAGKKGRRMVEIDPKDIMGYYAVDHEISPITFIERAQKAQLLADAHTRKAVSMRYYQEEGLGLQAPEQMQMEVMVEELAASGEYKGVLLQDFLDWLQMDEEVWAQGTPENMPLAAAGAGMPLVEGVGAPLDGQMITPPPGTQGPDMRQGGGGGGM